MRFVENKLVVALVVVATVVLAIVAVFTAIRLYQLRGESVSLIEPKSKPYAFSCQDYELLIDTVGTVRIKNVSTETQPSAEIDLIVNGQSLGSFTVPQLSPENDTILGNINLPTGDFNWSIGGDVFCQGTSEGTVHETSVCNVFNFTVSAQEVSPSPTVSEEPSPTPTRTPTTSPTPTTAQVGGPVSTGTPTPVQLPDSGVSLPTLLGIGAGLFIIIGALLLAI